MKKLISVVLTICVFFSLSVQVFAAEPATNFNFTSAMFRACMSFSYKDQYYLEENEEEFLDFGKSYSFYDNDTDDFAAVICPVESNNGYTDAVIIASNQAPVCIDMAVNAYEFIDPDADEKAILNALMSEKDYVNGNILLSSMWDHDFLIVIIENTEADRSDSSSDDNTDSEETQPIDVSIGDIITFGRYEQDATESNGPEPIEWIVLDVQDGKALLVSKYILDNKAYNEERGVFEWESCSLRQWLNGFFYKAAFIENEKNRVIERNNDNVFVLSNTDLNKYMIYETKESYFGDKTFTYVISSDVSPDVYGLSTHYSEKQGLHNSSHTGYASWWVNWEDVQNGLTRFNSYYGDNYGVIYDCSVEYGKFGVELADCKFGIRPAIWIDISDCSSLNGQQSSFEDPSNSTHNPNRKEIPSIQNGKDFNVTPLEFAKLFEDFLNGKYSCYKGTGGKYELRISEETDTLGSLYRNGKFMNLFVTMITDEGNNSDNINGVMVIWIPTSATDYDNYSEYFTESASAVMYLCSDSYGTYKDSFNEVVDRLEIASKKIGDTDWIPDGNFEYQMSVGDAGVNGPAYIFGFTYREK